MNVSIKFDNISKSRKANRGLKHKTFRVSKV